MTTPVTQTASQSLGQSMKQTEQTSGREHQGMESQSEQGPSLLSILSGDDDVVKNRLIGALVWVLLVLWFVPSWYSDPAYQQQPEMKSSSHHQPIVVKPLVKPPEVIAEEQAKAAQAAKEKKAQEEQERLARLQSERQQRQKAESKAAVAEVSESSARKLKQTTDGNRAYIVKLATFQNKALLTAALNKAKKSNYTLDVKEYQKTQDGKTYVLFSLRTKKYDSYDKAQKAKQNLDKILRLKGSFIRKVDLKSQN